MNLELKKMPKTENMFRNCAMPSSHQKAWSFSLVREKSSEPPLMIVNPSGWPTFPPENFFGPETWKISPESHFYFFRVFFVPPMWGFPKIVVPPNHTFWQGFPLYPIWGTRIFGNTHIKRTYPPLCPFFGRAELLSRWNAMILVQPFLLSWGIFPWKVSFVLLGGYQNYGGNSNIFYFHPDPWGNDPIWLIVFKWVETTNQVSLIFWEDTLN